MSRPVARTVTMTARFRALTPVHVGVGREDGAVDLPVARDGTGRPVIPGTSLAGVLRHRVTEVLGDAAADRWFGRTVTRTDTPRAGGASHVVVDDAPIMLVEGAVPESRPHVAIDRRTGSARRGHLFTREVIPAGATAEVTVTVEVPPDAPDAGDLLAVLAATLDDRDLRVGGATTRGLGRLAAEAPPEIVERSWQGPEAVVAALTGGRRWEAGEVTSLVDRGRELAGPGPLVIEIDWEPVGPIHVGGSAGGIAVDALPMVTGDGQHLRFVVPGSSIKGALRSAAERVVRTVLDLDAPDGEDGDLSAQTDLPLVDRLFGTITRHDAGGGPGGRRGAVWIDDCPSIRAMGRAQWQEVITAGSEGEAADAVREVVGALEEVGLRDGFADDGPAHLDPAHHVMVDRWTGGATDQLLFTVMEPWMVRFDPIRIAVDHRLLAADTRGAGDGADGAVDDADVPPGGSGPEADAALHLLWVVLRLLEEGWIPLGSRTRRGHGEIRVRGIRVAGGPEGLAPLRGDWASVRELVGAAASLAPTRAWAQWREAAAASASTAPVGEGRS